jgi:hypothetical protein
MVEREEITAGLQISCCIDWQCQKNEYFSWKQLKISGTGGGLSTALSTKVSQVLFSLPCRACTMKITLNN